MKNLLLEEQNPLQNRTLHICKTFKKPDIGDEKPDIDGMFSPKTTNQIWMLRKKFTDQSIFDRTDIMATLDKKCPEHRSW
ncbi:MAG: hypothetical protein SOS22_06380 [Absicoccus sp.]|uniref:hypothetical protein n=1 Tax=Absicoccus sp. TaxID=2718527 RepID=UPI002A75EE1A|nr:hypothetical protein [Absicoccus sp.]MDY3035830.1 hypothetical protein [Absicoccus sp.]